MATFKIRGRGALSQKRSGLGEPRTKHHTHRPPSKDGTGVQLGRWKAVLHPRGDISLARKDCVGVGVGDQVLLGL